ncbi:S10 family peptidase [Rhizorhabdus sp. FW153]|uniref:S10 family peptidase n=1 Tax=Rhizorhabdus sp. FW153 TaxID=3400216 RepID=UPI003CF68CBB
MRFRTAVGRAMLAASVGLCAAMAQPAAAAQGDVRTVVEPVDHPAVVTKHKGRFGGQTITYTATVAGLPVTTAAGQGARIVSFAYTRDGIDPATRPVMFLFNGGPIVASHYLHIGGIGPKRVAYPDDVKADPSTFALVDNVHSPLDAVDMVFVDPASTGFSRVAAGTDPRAYFSVRTDAAQFVAFIRAWLKVHGRERSPVYLTGESYGTNRAAEIAGILADGAEPLKLAGIFLYGQAANIVEYSQRPANVTSYVASLPTIAAIAYYHGKADCRGRTLEAFLADARSFAKGDYLTTLYQGSAASDADRRRVADRLAEFSGLSADWYLANGLKITKERYRVELLRDRGLLLGRSDARYTAPITEQGNGPDPADVLAQGVQRFMPIYLREDLKVDWKDPYVPAVEIGSLEDWIWGEGSSPFADWPYYKGISKMMALNPDFRLLIGNGIYDTQTTMGAAELLATQSGWDPARVTLRYYDGGHTGYSVAATARAIGGDIRALVR